MDETHGIDYRNTGYFSKLICDYLDQKPELQKYYNRFPSIENFKAQIEDRKPFQKEQRELLAEVLTEQYQSITSEKEKTTQNILQLRDSNTFTVVTGHQLNIFTGPLYFIYKIISTINLCKQLKEQYPDFNFVPVYWMASEDHDFAEINYINFKGEKLVWRKQDGGPVGRFSTDGLKEIIEELAQKMGPGTFANQFTELLKSSYLDSHTLAAATRQLTHSLFGDDGLVVIDGDDAKLKKSMIPHFKRELFEGVSHREVSQTSSTLQQEYFEQVHPREINLFYILDGVRERIVNNGNRWEVLETSISFTKEEIEQELINHPESFSPNVILRPLYQEVILPNLAYIGGGGELAYWFQLKGMFKAFDVPFPILSLRNSVLWVDEKSDKQIEKLEISVDQLFRPIEDAKGDFVKERAPLDMELEPYEQKLQQMFDDLEEVANLTDRSMLGAVNAQRQKQLNGLENLKKKLVKAEKKRQEVSMSRFNKLHETLFPNGSLQERYSNLSELYMEYGNSFISTLKSRLNPLDFRFMVLASKSKN